MLALRTIAAAFVFAAILGFSRFSFGLLLPNLMHDLHGTYGAYGIVAAANFAGYLAGTAAVPLLLKARGNARLWNATALCGMALTMILTSSSTALWQVGVLRFLVGLCSGVAAILTIAIALEGVRENWRGIVSGGIWAGGGLGLAVCGALIDPHAHMNWRVQYALMAAASIVALATFVGFRSHSTARTQQARPQLKLNSTFVRIAAAYAFFGFGYIVYMVYAPAYRVHAGDTGATLATSWILFGAGGAAGALVWGKIFDKYRTPVTLCAALILGVVGVVANLPFLTGMTIFGTPAIVSALARDMADDASYAKALATLTACFGVGQIAGPVGAGLVIDHAGLTAGIPMTAAPMMLAAAAAYVRRAR